MNLVNCSKVTVKECKYGVGAFAAIDIKKDELIETGLVRRVKVNPDENQYVFSWSKDDTVWAMASGCLTFYNHSNNPNTKVIKHFEEDKIEVVALRDIDEGEELTHLYKGQWRKCFQDLEG